MEWTIKKFEELTLSELYSSLRLRCEIFIVEQVPYQDVDNLDQQAYHMFAKGDDGEVIAYLRIFPHGIVYDEAAIGRVCVRADHRRKGIASDMLDRAIEFISNDMNEPHIHISAQQYLLDFYKSKGFIPHGEGYLEDGIPHISMIR
ncbi:MAG: GNAT family N-acetyltransferase [Clostridia bacterium]|nr:GNAT family N-acetyltransferase [Clostridia bacterium]